MQANRFGALKTPAFGLGFFFRIVGTASMAALFLVCTPSGAHESSESGAGIPVISSHFKAPSGIDIRVVQTTVNQFALATDGTHQVDILDPQGRAFIRLRDGKVQADLNAAAWFRAQQPGGGKVPALLMAKKDLPPQWSTVAEQTGYGWYDKRLVDDPPKPFKLSLRVDGKRIVVPVAVSSKPVMHGFWQPEVTQSPDTELTAMIPGVSGSVILLSRPINSEKTLQVLDDQGQAFIELRKDGVWVNQHHKWFAQLKLYGKTGGPEDWIKVNQGHTVTYQDPRIQASWPDNHKETGHWSIPVLIDGNTTPDTVLGEVHWQAVKH